MGIIKELYDEMMYGKCEKEAKNNTKKSRICMITGESCEFGICEECEKKEIKSVKW